jgi:hypothetical protein
MELIENGNTVPAIDFLKDLPQKKGQAMPAETKTHFVEPDECFLMSAAAAIDLIESELTRCYENKHQTPYVSPFKSSLLADPQTYSNGYITIRPYYWGNDDDMARLPNFECEELQVSWYKHSHRGLYVKLVGSHSDGHDKYQRLGEILYKAVESIRKDFGDGPSY